MEPKCIIIENTVTAICNAACMLNNGMMVLPIPPQHLSISGTLTTTNPIMANWSREMWQGVVNRVLRNLSSGTFGRNFISAVLTVS
nr:hypothetical protein [Angiostrongylus cantonensis]